MTTKTNPQTFIAQVKRGNEWETIRYADRKRSELYGKNVTFDSFDEALAAGRRAWGPIKAKEGDDYRAALAAFEVTHERD